MRALGLSIVVLLAALALGACGGDDNGDSAPTTGVSLKPAPARGVSTAVSGYVRAFNDGDGARACRLLDDRGKASLIALLPSDQESIGCAAAVRRISRQAVKPRTFKVEDVIVKGRSASANVNGSDPPYASGVLLAYENNAWKISFPPGLQTKSGAQPSPAPGVPLEQD